MLSWYSGDNNMIEPLRMEEDPDGTSHQVAVIMTGKIYREAGLKHSKHPEVEGLLYDKLCQIGKHKLRDDVRKMALSIALSVSDKEFQPTVSWLENFMRRFCLSNKKMGFHSSAMLKQKGTVHAAVKPAANLQSMTQEDVFSVLGFTADCTSSAKGEGLQTPASSKQNSDAGKSSECSNSLTDCLENIDNSKVGVKKNVDETTSTRINEVNDADKSTKDESIPGHSEDDTCAETSKKLGKGTDVSLSQDVSSTTHEFEKATDDEIVVLENNEEVPVEPQTSSGKERSESKIGKISIKKLEDLCEVDDKNEDSGNNSEDCSSNTDSDSSDESEWSDEMDGEKAETSKSDGQSKRAMEDKTEAIIYTKAETKYYNKNKKTLQKKLEGAVMKCTSCYEQVNHHMSSLVFTHPVLGLFICKKCSKFYGKGVFRKDSEGYDEYCRLCAEGGDLLCCEQKNCFNGFCKRCVKRTMGRGELKRAETAEGWACYVCDPQPLMELRALHRLILNNLRTSTQEDENLSRKDLKSKTLKQKFETLKQVRQLRSQKEPSSSSKSTEPVVKKSKTHNSVEDDGEVTKRDDGKNCNRIIEEHSEASMVTSKKTEDEGSKPCPVLRNTMDEMLGMLSQCLNNVKTIDSKWKKSKYSSEGTKKTRNHVVKQLEAIRNNFKILEDDLLEYSRKENRNIVKETNEDLGVSGLTSTKSLQDKKNDAEMMEGKDSKIACMKSDIISDTSESLSNIVSLEKTGNLSDKGSEKKNGNDKCEQPNLDLDVTAADNLESRVDPFEDCSQDSSKACLQSNDDEHSLPDLMDVINEVISDPDEAMDVEKMTMIKSLDMETEVSELLGEVQQKTKTESPEDLPLLKVGFIGAKSNDDTLISHNDDKEANVAKNCKNKKLRSASDESSLNSDAEIAKSGESNEGNAILNGTRKESNGNKKLTDDKDLQADTGKVTEDVDKNVGTQNSDKISGKFMNRSHRVENESDTEVGKTKRPQSSRQRKDSKMYRGTDDDDEQEKGTNIRKIKDDNGKKIDTSKVCNGKNSASNSRLEDGDKEVAKGNISESKKNLKGKEKQKNSNDVCESDDDDKEEGDKDIEGNSRDSETGETENHHSSVGEVSNMKKKKNKCLNSNTSKRSLRKKSTVTNDIEDDEEEKNKRGKKRRRTRNKAQTEDEEGDVLLGLVRKSDTSEDNEEIQNESEEKSEECNEKQKKRRKHILRSEKEEKEGKDRKKVDVKVRNSIDKTDSEHDEKKTCKQNIDSEENIDTKSKAIKSESLPCPDGSLKKESGSEGSEEPADHVQNGIALDKDLESPKNEKNRLKKRKGQTFKTENQRAKIAILKSDSEDELEDKPKPRSKKKYYRRQVKVRRGRSQKKLQLKMTEEDEEELKQKQLNSKCQVRVAKLSAEISKTLEEEEFIYTSDYPELKYQTLSRQMSDGDGCDADEEDSDKEFHKLMKFKCGKIKPGPKSKSPRLKLKLMGDEGCSDDSDDNKREKDGKGDSSDEDTVKGSGTGVTTEATEKKKEKVNKPKREGLLDIDIDEEGEDSDDEEMEEGMKKKNKDGGISLNEKMKKHILMSSDEEVEEEEEEDKEDKRDQELEEEEREKKKFEKRKEAAKKKAKDEQDSEGEYIPKVHKKGYMNLNVSTDEEEDKEEQQEDETREDEEEPEPESAYEDDSDFEESPRKRRAFQLSSSDSERDSKKTRKPATTEDESEEEEEKPKSKRKRIRKMSSSSDDDDDDDNEGNKESPSKHKKIRKVIRDEDLTESTKNATQEEEERRKRVAERQKHYNEIFLVNVEADQEGLDKLVLDFDPKTKSEIVSVHEKLVKLLKPHQFKGIRFMWDATVESLEQLKTKRGGGCILAHSMGLGKTLQVITYCHTLLTNKNTSRQVQKILVCCPVNTIFNWVAEFSSWLKGKMLPFDVIELASAKDLWGRAYRLDDWWKEGGICIIGYNMFRNLSNSKGKRFKSKMREIFQKTLLDPGPDVVVCDEGHLLKNEKTALSIAMNKIRTLRRIVLTGTPLQNNLKEYHCMIQFVKPNLLGTKKEFMNRFVNPIEQGQCVEAMPRDVRRMKRRAHILHNLLEGCVQRFDYTVLKPYLPPKFEYVVSVQLSEIQCKLYQYYLDNLARGGPKRQGSGLFVDFGALSRVWTHPKVLELALRRAVYDEDEDDLDDFICDDTTASESSDDERSRKTKKSTKNDEESEEEEVAEAEAEKSDTVEGLTESGKVRADWWKKIVVEAAGEDFEEEGYLEQLEHSGKLILLLDILRECCLIGDKVLLFSQSLLTLDMIEIFLEAIDQGELELPSPDDSLPLPYKQWKVERDYLRLDGSTSAEARKSMCKIFNNSSNERCRLFLISTRAGGLGINLVGANRVIIFDSSWNPSHDTQSIFRVYRFGQKKPSYIYRFVAQGTMEEKIYSRQVTKMSTALRVVDEHQIKRYFKMDELSQLYEFNPSDSDVRETPIVPKDRLLAELLQRQKNWIVTYHEHESLLENQTSEELTEEERKAAWEDYENEKKGFMAQNYRNSVMSVMGAPTMMNQPGLPSLSLSSFSFEGVVSTIKAQNPHMTPMELCESVLLATKQIQKVHLNHYQRVQAMVYNLKNPMIAPEQRKLLPFGNHPEMLPMLEQQLRLLEENIQRENQVISHIDQGTAQQQQLSTANLMSAGLLRGQPTSSGMRAATANYVERPSSSSAGRPTTSHSENYQEKKTGSNDVILLD